jgi:hypothetical protein
MKRPSKRTLVFLGLGLVIIGLGIHTEGSLLLWKNYYYQIAPGETYGEALPILPKYGEMSINLYLNAFSSENLDIVTVIFVNASEYERFEDGASVAELVCLASIDLVPNMEEFRKPNCIPDDFRRITPLLRWTRGGHLWHLLRSRNPRVVLLWVEALPCHRDRGKLRRIFHPHRDVHHVSFPGIVILGHVVTRAV